MGRKASVSAPKKQQEVGNDIIGKKPDIKEWSTPSGLQIMSGWARRGLSFKEISDKIGITDRTLRNWRKQEEKIDTALQTNREMAVLGVEGRLWNEAMSGNTTAMIFYLKNTAPDKWRDHPASIELEIKKAENERIKLENEKRKLEFDQRMLEFKMESLRYQISGAQGEEKDAAIREFIAAVNPTQDQIDELYDDEEDDEEDEVIDDDADD